MEQVSAIVGVAYIAFLLGAMVWSYWEDQRPEGERSRAFRWLATAFGVMRDGVARGLEAVGFGRYEPALPAALPSGAGRVDEACRDLAQVGVSMHELECPTGHRAPVPVRATGLEGELVAWLCTDCDTQLPADWKAAPGLDADGKVAMVDLFHLDGEVYQMPAYPPAGVGVEYLRIVYEEGADAGDRWLLYVALGADGFEALAHDPALDLGRVLDAVRGHYLGDKQLPAEWRTP